MFQDKILTCKDCGAEFVFTAGEQEFYAEKGFQNEPLRCPQCRNSRRRERQSGGEGRTMYPAVCASCGTETAVPFKPSGVRPVYCSNCFQEQNRRY